LGSGEGKLNPAKAKAFNSDSRAADVLATVSAIAGSGEKSNSLGTNSKSKTGVEGVGGSAKEAAISASLGLLGVAEVGPAGAQRSAVWTSSITPDTASRFGL